MSLPKITALLAVTAMSLGLLAGAIAQDTAVDPAIAAMSPEELVAARKAAMKENGGLMRGAGSLTGAEAVAAAEVLIKNFQNFSAMFPEGSLVGDTKALPLIWQEKEAFDAIFAKGLQGALDMKAAAEAGDAAAYAESQKVIGGSCGECHQKYRS